MTTVMTPFQVSRREDILQVTYSSCINGPCSAANTGFLVLAAQLQVSMCRFLLMGRSILQLEAVTSIVHLGS